MAGFAARTSPASGTHDPLTVRAICVDDTALVTVDAVGLHEDTCAEVRRRCPLPAGHVVVHATHTHGGPASMPGRLGHDPDPGWLAAVVDACVAAVTAALERRRLAVLRAGYGADPGVARNRRRPDGPVDGLVPVAWFTAESGDVLAVVASHACHPVVLGADNTQWTADYPGVVRAELEARHPGAVAVFVTGCAGDVNQGHSAHASISTAASPIRTFAEANRIGRLVAEAVEGAPCRPALGEVRAASADVRLDLDLPTIAALERDVHRWETELPAADPARAALLEHWLRWARTGARRYSNWTGAVAVLRWGGVRLVALPGEPFAVAAQMVRAELPGDEVTFVLGYSGGCPGYLPAREEYAYGGYEVCEAYRFYGMPGGFAAGSLERLVDQAVALAG